MKNDQQGNVQYSVEFKVLMYGCADFVDTYRLKANTRNKAILAFVHGHMSGLITSTPDCNEQLHEIQCWLQDYGNANSFQAVMTVIRGDRKKAA